MSQLTVVCSYLISAAAFLNWRGFISEGKDIHVPRSPCPRVFDYFRTVVWLGRLTVPVPRNGLPVVTRVLLSLKGTLRSRYVGFIELVEPVEMALDNVNWGATIVNYTVRFPIPYPLPTLTTVVVNNVTICQNVDTVSTYGVTTTLSLEHTFPTNVKFKSTTKGLCGVKTPSNVHSLQVNGFGEWPWLAAVLLKRPGGLEFHCTGNLVTDRHVLTAAHCVAGRFGPNSPRQFVVYLGKYDLTRWNEPNSQIRNVARIVVHPDYLLNLITADLAFLVLSKPVVFTLFVRPVCLWRSSDDLRPLVGRTGTVAGWGKIVDTGNYNSRPRTFQLPIVDQTDCLRSRRDYFYLTSGQTLCAGLRNGTGPCNGDSGSGLVLPESDEDFVTIWYLRAVLSLSLLDPLRQTCDLTNYLVFTDVAQFADWIANVVRIT